MLFGAKIGEKTEKQGQRQSLRLFQPLFFGLQRQKWQVTFWVSLLSKEFGKLTGDRI